MDSSPGSPTARPTETAAVPVPRSADDSAGSPTTRTDTAPPAGRAYALDNTDPRAGSHHALLATLLDPFSTTRTLNLLDLRGARCLDVGAGAGHYAHWLAEQVGPTGHVLATDIHPLTASTHPQLAVMRHDLTGNEPLGSDWDFIHARLVLGHLPQRRQILPRLIDALRPGGHLLVQDWDASRTDMVLHAPTPDDAEAYTRFQETLGAKVFAAAGTDRNWARRIHGTLLDAGMDQVHTVIHAESWTGGGTGCRLVAGTLHQAHTTLLTAGLTGEDLDYVTTLLQDPRLVLAGHLLYSTSARKPPRASSGYTDAKFGKNF